MGRIRLIRKIKFTLIVNISLYSPKERTRCHGGITAWLALVGFIIIMFNLIAVNLIIAGLHSYA